jgi:hypothetical protein
MAIDLAAKSDAELENIVANHRRLQKYNVPLFLEALAILERKKSRGFDIEKTIAIIRDSAREQRFLNYRDIAQASGLEWSYVHWAIGPHLMAVCEYAHGKGSSTLIKSTRER